MFSQIYVLCRAHYLHCRYLLFYSSAAVNSETNPVETLLPEDSPPAADEELTSFKVAFIPLLPAWLKKPKWAVSHIVSPRTHPASFQSCSLSSLLVLRTQQCLKLCEVMAIGMLEQRRLS